MNLDQRNNILENSLEELEFGEILNIISKFAYSEAGAEKIQSLRPFTENSEIRNELDLLAEMIKIIDSKENLSFEGFSDISEIFKKAKISNSVLSAGDILDVFDLIQCSRRIFNFFDLLEEEYPLLNQKTAGLHHNKQLERHISEIIDESGEIKDNASPELRRIRSDINRKSQQLRDRVNKILRKTMEADIAQEDFVSVREDRFVIPIKVSNKRTFNGIIHGYSSTGQTVFLEPQEVVEANNEISLLRNEEKREIYRLLEMLTRSVAKDADAFIYSIEVLADLDVIAAKARFSNKFECQKPRINDNNVIRFNDVRHPLLIKKLGKKNVVPLSVDLDDENVGFVISGPNAGGKTVSLKTVGLSTAMALSGIFTTGEVEVCNRSIFTSIGDHQSIENDLSTFSSQISQIRDIIDHAGGKSLVLIDEICSGTDPQEGSALACGIMDTFVEYGIYFVVTTHQSSLKNYALNKGIVKNASLEFDEANLKPSYKFLAGIPGNSYAFNLADNIGLNKAVISRAEKYTFGGQLDLEKSISELNKYKKEAADAKIEHEKLNKILKDKELIYSKKYNDLKLKQKEILDQAKHEAALVVEKANKMIENKIREIEEQKKASGEIKKEFNKEKDAIIKESEKIKKEEKELEPEVIDNTPLKVGDSVLMKEGDSSIGTLLEINGKQAEVDFNGLKFKVKLNKLKRSKKAPEKEKTESFYSGVVKFSAPATLDIRGMRANEAIAKLDKQISDSVTSNVPELTIVHGKGTGALREAVRDFLETNHLIQSFREGKLVEGGSGVTIINL